MRHHHKHHDRHQNRDRHGPAHDRGELRGRGRRHGEQAAPEARRARAANPEFAERAAPLSQAILNLRAAIDGRLAEDGLERAVILDVAGLIDQAASHIERL